jgi:predicted transcriptional regulator
MSWLNPELGRLDELRGKTGRRSRLEMTFDVLYVISQGVEKPTRIMQISNITWKDLLGYLGTLLRNQLITREMNGSRVGYKLTEKGEKAVDLYVQLREMASELKLENGVPGTESDPLRNHSLMDKGTVALLKKRLKFSGCTIEDNRVLGRSGQTHVFDVVARASDDTRRAYVLRDLVTEEHVLGLFISQLDTELGIHVNYMKEPSEETQRLADSYSIVLERWQG